MLVHREPLDLHTAGNRIWFYWLGSKCFFSVYLASRSSVFVPTKHTSSVQNNTNTVESRAGPLTTPLAPLGFMENYIYNAAHCARRW